MVRAILIDAMGTLFVPPHNMGRFEHLQLIMKSVLNREASATDIERAFREKRKELEQTLPFTRHSELWSIINREMLRSLFPGVPFEIAAEEGMRMNREFLTNPRWWEIPSDMRSFIFSANHRGIGVLVASNQDADKLSGLVGAFFPRGSCIKELYTSSEIGYEKPSPKFFSGILEREQLRPSECMMIGNNPTNDVEGARNVGIIPVLFDREGKYPAFEGYRVERLSDIWNLDIFAPPPRSSREGA